MFDKINSRIKNSFGQIHVNEGTVTEIKQEKYKIDYSRKFYLFDVIPMGAPRMTKSDTWKLNPNHPDPKKRQRKCITQYFNFKNILTVQALQMGYKLGDSLDVVFFIPMPDSWSEKKKDKMNGMPCKVKPDEDNLIKSVQDTLRKNDSSIWYAKILKIYSTYGSILIYATK